MAMLEFFRREEPSSPLNRVGAVPNGQPLSSGKNPSRFKGRVSQKNIDLLVRASMFNVAFLAPATTASIGITLSAR